MAGGLTRIDVSPEMVAFYGAGAIGQGGCPDNAHSFVFDLTESSFEYRADVASDDLDEDVDRIRLILIVCEAACERLRGQPSSLSDGQSYHMPVSLRSIAIALSDCALPEGAQHVYRGAKCIELLCETVRLEVEGKLLPFAAVGLSIADSQRVVAARRIIDERWAEKLTIGDLARTCGLNRGKLTRGFRDLFDCSVADAIAEQRLSSAGKMLLATDLPVSSIGYRCGYLSNASFTRAFARYFGVAPTRYRAAGLAA